MRVNIYEEELTNEISITQKLVPETGFIYYGVRLFLKSSPELHHTETDDDRSAITIWVGSFSNAMKLRRELREVLLDIRGYDDVEGRTI